ncbi:MAG TPA: CDP-alcohol phosphatidyltransferase family protein [Thermoplasmata archaeon]|nr:CDP-alcohol phosphatidyltransferase family protein [Thermoplasmata archaeon]
MTDRWRLGANLATLANALLGVGAILYVLAGNKLWAMFLIVAAIGFDGLDGLLSRKSPLPSGRFGRIADSLADATTFGVAPAFLIAIHTSNVAVWRPYVPLATALAIAYGAAAIARLVYFTARAHHLSHFLGVPTPESALALVVALLFHDTPAFQGVQPIGVLVGVAVLAVMMVVPVPYPKIRRGAPLRWPATATAVCAAVALVPLQFQPARGSLLFSVADVAAFGMLVGVASYYLLGPLTTPREPPAPA